MADQVSQIFFLVFRLLRLPEFQPNTDETENIGFEKSQGMFHWGGGGGGGARAGHPVEGRES